MTASRRSDGLVRVRDKVLSPVESAEASISGNPSGAYAMQQRAPCVQDTWESRNWKARHSINAKPGLTHRRVTHQIKHGHA